MRKPSYHPYVFFPLEKPTCHSHVTPFPRRSSSAHREGRPRRGALLGLRHGGAAAPGQRAAAGAGTGGNRGIAIFHGFFRGVNGKKHIMVI